jgi:hypothetical protein
LLKEILFGAGGVSLVSLGILSVHWNIREVVAYKTGIGKKVRVVKGGTEHDEVVKYKSTTLKPLGKVKFAEADLESTLEKGSKKLEVAKEESYIYTQAVVGDLGDVIDDMLDKQKEQQNNLGSGIVPEVDDGLLDDVEVDVYEGTQVLTGVSDTEEVDTSTQVLTEDPVEEDTSTQVLVEEVDTSTQVLTEDINEEEVDTNTQVLTEDVVVEEINEHTQVLIGDVHDEEIETHTQVLVEPKEDNTDYFTTVLENEPEIVDGQEDYGTDILVSEHGDISDEESEYLTQTLVDSEELEEIDVVEDVEEVEPDYDYVTQVLVGNDENEEEAHDEAYVTQVLVPEVSGEVEETYVTQVLAPSEEDYNTTVLSEEDEEESYHTVTFDDDGTTGNVAGESVENVDVVGIDEIKVIYTNYEMEEE